MKNITKVGLLTLLLCTSCLQCNFMPQDGDLLFCVAGSSTMSNAIVNATKTEETVQFDHVALYATIDGKPCVIEASPDDGVICRDWNSFLADAKKGVVVKRIDKKFDVNDVINRAKQYVGQPYDWSFLPDNNKLYCSELIYETYLNENGNHVFRAKPMNFRNDDGSMPSFWIELFKKLGESIPEGALGTNPNDMSKEQVLKEVHRFFKPDSVGLRHVNTHKIP